MTRIPFGRHAGQELAEVPHPYLRWLRRQPWLGGWLAKEIDDELSDKAAASDEDTIEKIKQKWNTKNKKHKEITNE